METGSGSGITDLNQSLKITRCADGGLACSLSSATCSPQRLPGRPARPASPRLRSGPHSPAQPGRGGTARQRRFEAGDETRADAEITWTTLDYPLRTIENKQKRVGRTAVFVYPFAVKFDDF
ncbi:MAG: hypothetical protein H6656_18730 [Ardenticatenaceae bacterium]|nr:hypothetical protein [Ardenticatenaceae bacterium]